MGRTTDTTIGVTCGIILATVLLMFGCCGVGFVFVGISTGLFKEAMEKVEKRANEKGQNDQKQDKTNP